MKEPTDVKTKEEELSMLVEQTKGGQDVPAVGTRVGQLSGAVLVAMRAKSADV
jgi:hypothetical protein